MSEEDANLENPVVQDVYRDYNFLPPATENFSESISTENTSEIVANSAEIVPVETVANSDVLSDYASNRNRNFRNKNQIINY